MQVSSRDYVLFPVAGEDLSFIVHNGKERLEFFFVSRGWHVSTSMQFASV